jgi:hypothetical protein
MDLPLHQIKTLIETRQINDVAEIFDFGTEEQWKDLLLFRKDVIFRMKNGTQKFRWVHAYVIARAIRVEYKLVENIVPDHQWVKKASEQRLRRID